MTSVFTDLGPGEVVESKTLRGLTSYRVAGQDFDMWFDATKLGFAPVDDSNSVDLPYNPEPQYGIGALTDATIQPIHEIDPDKRTHPADSLSFDERENSEAGNEPGPAPHLFAAASGIRGPHWNGMEADPEDAYGDPSHPFHEDWLDSQDAPIGGPRGHNDNYGEPHPSDHYDENIDLPYPEDVYTSPMTGEQHNSEGHMLLDHGDEGPLEPGTDTPWAKLDHSRYRQADVLEGAPTRLTPDMMEVNDTEEPLEERWDVEEDDRDTTDPEGIVHFSSTQRDGFAMAIPMAAEALAGAEGGGAAMGILRGVGTGIATDPGGAEKKIEDGVKKVDADGNPLPLPDLGNGWGSLTQLQGSYRPAGLDSRYADIIEADYHHNPVAQFRHDPEAFINRTGHVHFEGLDPKMGSYMDMVEGDEQLRTAAWKDVREKAMRLRREGRVHVKDIDADRIYASVEGDHGTYDTMIKKGGAFGGFGGGHTITSWHCACEWGKWAFQRRYTFVGRLCSHGYAAYMEMNSNHMKGKPRQTAYPKRKKRAHDQTTQDWKIDDTGKARGALDDLREWAEQPHETWNGHQDEHNEDVRDAVDRAREEGVDASQLVASLMRHADEPKPGEYDPETGRDVPGGTGVLQGDMGSPFSQNFVEPNSSLDQSEFGGGTTPAPASPATDIKNNPANSLINPGGGGGGATDSSSNQSINPNGGTGYIPTPGGGGSADNTNIHDVSKDAGDSMYTVKPGDTLSGIADSQGLSGYNDITNLGGGDIANKDLITPGQTLDLSAVGGGAGSTSEQGGGFGSSSDSGAGGIGNSAGGGSSAGSGGSSDGWWGKSSRIAAPVDPNNPVGGTSPGAPGTGAAGSAVNQAGNTGVATDAVTSPGQQGLDAIGGGSTPGQDGFDAASAAMNTPANGTDDGASAAAGQADAGFTQPSADSAGGFNMDNLTETMGGIGDMVSSGAGMVGDIAGGIGDAVSSISGIFGARELTADRDWLLAAYPDGIPVGNHHKPFAGSGGENITEWGQSKDNVKENYSDDRADVTEEPKKSHLSDLDSLEQARIARKHADAPAIGRLGGGPRKPAVQPVVVRQQRVANPRVVEADHMIESDFDPLASRRPEDFLDDDAYAGRTASVADFQNSDAARALMGGGSSTKYDDFSSSPVWQQVAARNPAMTRTAGRNYSMAEQAALVREGDIGGAGNLDQLQLAGTHYEAENSIGLW